MNQCVSLISADLQAWHRELLNEADTREDLRESSTRGASFSTDSMAEVRSVASPTIVHTGRPNDGSFASDSPHSLSRRHSDDVLDARSGDIPV